MAADTAVELRKYNVTSVSLWPGAVRTELTGKMMEAGTVTIDTGKATFEHVRLRQYLHIFYPLSMIDSNK
jgi:NAD(P)-dependent dehydrogenase (short-subunit alcohol dehydrogenase family)